MKFRAQIDGVSSTVADTMLLFSKTNILFPKTMQGNPFVNTELKHDIPYTLAVVEVNGKRRYQITYGRNHEIKLLSLNLINEFWLKWIHKMYWIKKEPLAVIAIIISVLSLSATIVLGVLQMRHK